MDAWPVKRVMHSSPLSRSNFMSILCCSDLQKTYSVRRPFAIVSYRRLYRRSIRIKSSGSLCIRDDNSRLPCTTILMDNIMHYSRSMTIKTAKQSSIVHKNEDDGDNRKRIIFIRNRPDVDLVWKSFWKKMTN